MSDIWLWQNLGFWLLQDGFKTAQDGSRAPQKGANTVSNAYKAPSKGIVEAYKLKDRCLIDVCSKIIVFACSKTAQDGSKTFQDGAHTVSNAHTDGVEACMKFRFFIDV